MPNQLYPPEKEKERIDKYKLYESIFKGEHFEAFSQLFNKGEEEKIQKVKYVMANYGGMISKLSADMLFEEFPTIRFPEGDSDFSEAMIVENNLKIQLYESALENSFRGDAVFALRKKDNQLKIEDLNPICYFPKYHPGNVRIQPDEEDLIFEVELPEAVKKSYDSAIVVETHSKGKISYQGYYLRGTGTGASEMTQTDHKQFKGYEEIPNEVKTGVDDSLLVFHIKNFGINSSFFGFSDYADLISLFNAINKRLTRVDTILDKHGDPILAVPDGVLDEEGKVSRQSFGVIEVPTGEAAGQKPEYIVWDAKLESAFKEIEALTEMMMMTSETSKAAFGMDKDGQAESGRALKFKLLRTIAKKHRKELYFDAGLKKMFYVAQQFAKAQKLSCGSVKFSGVPVWPEIVWQDGVINDTQEQLEVEVDKLDNDLTTQEEAIQAIDGSTEAEAAEKAAKINAEKDKKTPFQNDFSKNPNQSQSPDKNQNNNE